MRKFIFDIKDYLPKIFKYRLPLGSFDDFAGIKMDKGCAPTLCPLNHLIGATRAIANLTIP